jgi:photosystem II stability/assembly factor-like uncharacterized protein
MKKQFIFINIFLFCFCSNSALSKYWWQNSLASSRACAILNDTTFIIAGDDGKIIKSIDLGKTWHWIETFNRRDFLDMEFLGEKTGAIVGQNGIFLKSTDGGETWYIKNIASDTLRSIQILDDLNYYTAGNKGMILKSIDSGNTWHILYEEPGINIQKVKFYDEITGIAVCNMGTILKTTDGGINWQKIRNGTTNEIFKDIEFLEKSTAIAVYDSSYSGNSKSVKITEFTVEEINIPEIIWKIKLIDTNKLFLLSSFGKYFISDNKLNISSDGKINCDKFTLMNDTIHSSPGLIIVGTSKKGEILITSSGFDQSIAYSGDFGENFELLHWVNTVTAPGLQKTLYSTEIIDSNNIIISATANIIRSSDGGVIWDHSYPFKYKSGDKYTYPVSVFYCSHFKNTKEGIVIGEYNFINSELKSNALFTNDGGNSWEKDTNVKVLLTNMSFYLETEGFGAKQNLVHHTFDMGRTWDTVKVTSGTDYIRDLASIDRNTVYLVTNSNDKTDDTIKYKGGYVNYTKILKTENTFKTVDTLFKTDYLDMVLSKIIRYNENLIVALGIGYKLLVTKDAGKTCETIQIPVWLAQDILLKDENNWIVVGKNDSLCITTDGGDTWKTELLGMNVMVDSLNYFMDIKQFPNGDVLIVGKGRIVKGVWHDENTDVEEPEVEYDFNPYFYIRSLPNPASESARIELYGLYSVKGIPLSVKIFDIFGNEARDFSNEANANNNGISSIFNADFSGLATGVYFIQLVSGRYAKVSKLTIIGNN